MTTISNKERFNAISNAEHIFSYCDNGTPLKILEVLPFGNNTKAIVQFFDGKIAGLFTDAVSASGAINEAFTSFPSGDAYFMVKQKKTAKDKTIYFVELLDDGEVEALHKASLEKAEKAKKK